jgi:ABC-type transport system involved in cytochrome c biogenesis permease subunit
MTRTKVFLLATAAAAVVAAAATLTFTASAGESSPHGAASEPSKHRFSREAVDLFARLPVQDGGRVKPLSTYAGFALLALNGKRTLKTPDGDVIEPTEWLMDCIFFPNEAAHFACFRVQESAVLDAAGLAHEDKKRRDWYSFDELEPAFDKFEELAKKYSQIDAKERNPVEGEVINLHHNLMTFVQVASLVTPIDRAPPTSESPGLTKVFGASSSPDFADVLERAGQIRPFLGGGEGPHMSAGSEGGGDAALRGWIDSVISYSRGLALLPPGADVSAGAEWLSPGDVADRTLYRGETLAPQVGAIRDLEAMSAARGDDAEFRKHAEAFRSRVVSLAESRGEYGKIPLEVTFYKADFFYWAQIAYVLGFVAVAFSWIKSSKFFTRTAACAVVVATLLCVAGITMRCVIRGRPPVSTLYETVLFITAVASIAALITEYVNRRGIALGLSTVLGSGGMFLAGRYELTEHVDTMPSLVAVLDTNFWLASHVTTVTIGYGAGLLAGAVGHLYVLGKVFGLKKNDAAFYKSLTTMTYGMLCFGLLFSTIGTILGGIWANESWGRFWGWDPKENGALTIVLWELIVLHARMGGYIRDFGIAMASVFGAAVVGASWWGVNLLGVGLHSYGFTSGILWSLLGFFAVEAAVLGIGGAWHAWFRPGVADTTGATSSA